MRISCFWAGAAGFLFFISPTMFSEATLGERNARGEARQSNTKKEESVQKRRRATENQENNGAVTRPAAIRTVSQRTSQI